MYLLADITKKQINVSLDFNSNLVPVAKKEYEISRCSVLSV